jgi:hypothetical protein
LKNIAKDADAAVCVDHEVHVFVRQGGALAHTDTVVTSGGATDSAKITAIRVAEIVRVRLERSPLGAAPTSSVAAASAPSSAASQVAAIGPEAERSSDKVSNGVPPKHGFHFGVAGGLLLDARPQGAFRIPALPIAALSLSYALAPRVEMTARAALAFGTAPYVIGGGYATLGPSFRLVDLDVIRLNVGGGAGGVYMEYDTPTNSIYPFVYADASLAFPVTESFLLSAAGSVGTLFGQDNAPVSTPVTGMLSASWLL